MINDEKQEIAKKVQHIIDCYDPMESDLMNDLCKLRDELSPPRPEPGTVVWWRDIEGLTEWDVGLVHWMDSDSSKLRILTPGGARLQFHEVQWKPAPIPHPGQVMVDPPKQRPEPGWYAAYVVCAVESKWYIGWFDSHGLYQHPDDDIPMVGANYIKQYYRILGPREVAVKIPPTSEWPEDSEDIRATYTQHNPQLVSKRSTWFREHTLAKITRAEAKEMENDPQTP